jgi:hypothetical protein
MGGYWQAVDPGALSHTAAASRAWARWCWPISGSSARRLWRAGAGRALIGTSSGDLPNNPLADSILRVMPCG